MMSRVKVEVKVESGAVHDHVVELLNKASLESDAQGKLDCIIQIQECVIHREPALLDSFLDEILAFQHDRSVDVRKAIVGFMEEACKKDNAVLSKLMPNLQLLLSDDNAQVQKRVVQALTQLYRITLSWLSGANSIDEEMEAAWSTLSQMKSIIGKMVDHDNDGVRTMAVKFYEMLVISQTYPEQDSICKENEFSLEKVPLNLKVARPRKLEEEAKQMLENLLMFHGSAHISSANLMACMGSLTHIAKSRPQFLEPIASAMQLLHSNLPPTLSQSQVSSVKKHLKLQLLSILKHPASYEHGENIKSVLTDLGATPSEIAKASPSAEEVARCPKRSLEVKGGPASKKRRLNDDDDDDDDEKPVVRPAEDAASITEEFIRNKLTPQTAAELVMVSLPRVGVSMKNRLTSSYIPVGASGGTQAQVNQVAKLLAGQLIAAGVGPGVEAAGRYPVKKEFEEDDAMVGRPATAPASEPLKHGAAPGVQSRIRQRPLKFSEMTKQLSPQMNDSMALSALNRLLKSERTAMLGGVASIRQKILSALASIFAKDFKMVMVDFIMLDPRARIELIFSWLYEQYSWIMGFCHSASASTQDTKQQAMDDYKSVFCFVVDGLINQNELKDRDTLLTRLYLESPSIPDAGVDQLQSLCEDTKSVVMAIQIVRQLVRRPKKQLVFLNVLLQVSSHEDEHVRSASLECLVQLYDLANDLVIRRAIDKYADVYLEFLLLKEPPAVLFGPEKGRPVVSQTWTEETIKACLYLYMTILPSSAMLVHKLAAVYVEGNADIKRTILRVVEGPIQGLGMQSPEVLKLVETCPKGAETLITRIIQIFTDKSPPSVELVDRVRELYHKRVPDIRFLIPVLHGLSKKEVLAVLPKLIKLNPDVVKKVFSRLLGTQGDSLAGYPSPVTPADLLVALHNVDSTTCDMKTIMKATSFCFMERSVYTQEVLAVVMQHLMDQNPLPTLLMRTVLQSLSLYPRLSGFVMNILQRLIVKQVWKQKKVWEGFIKCCQRTKPQSFSVMLQLPPKYLHELLNTSDDLKEPLLGHVMSFTDNQRMHIPKLTMDVLTGIAQFQAEEAADEVMDKEMNSPEPAETVQVDREPPAPGES